MQGIGAWLPDYFMFLSISFLDDNLTVHEISKFVLEFYYPGVGKLFELPKHMPQPKYIFILKKVVLGRSNV